MCIFPNFIMSSEFSLIAFMYFLKFVYYQKNYYISIIIIIIIAITYMQGIYNYIPETNHVSRVYNVAAVLHLQSVLQVMLCRP